MIALPAEVTFATASRVIEDAVRAAQAALRPSAAAGAAQTATAARPSGPDTAAGVLDVDLASCTTFDSSVLAVLLELSRQASAAGARCRMHHAPAGLRTLAGLYGADTLLFSFTDSGSVKTA